MINDLESIEQLLQEYFPEKNEDAIYKLSNPNELSNPIEEMPQSYRKEKNENGYGNGYGNLVEIVHNLNDINWLDQNQKIQPLRQLTPMTFWFIVCCEYFPRELPTIPKPEFSEIGEYEEVPQYSHDTFIMECHRWLKELAPNTDLDCLIDHYEKERRKIQNEIIENSEIRIEENLKVIYEKDYILRDLVGLTQVEQEYLSYLENKQQCNEDQLSNQSKTTNLAGTARQLITEIKSVCSICNEGIHSEDYIVVCSRCNISVHKKCYGIENIALFPWVCDLCLNFGPKGRFIKCPLCTKKGGAMKATSLLMRDSIFENTNPSYHQYATLNKIDRQKIQIDSQQQGQYYDFLQIQNLNENLENVKSERIWAHICCMNFLDSDLMLIDKKKFNLNCSICKSKRNGACVQCANCTIGFHPECARRGQMFMEKDKIYCYKHQPLKLKRVLDNKHNNWIEEIQLFFRQYDKLQQLIAKRPKNHDQQFQKIELKAQQEEIEQEIKAENEQLLKRIEEIIHNQSQFIITVQNQEVIEIQFPQTKNIYELSPEDNIWQILSDSKFSPEQIYILYQRAIRMRKKKKIAKHSITYEELPHRNRKSQYSRPKIIKRKQSSQIFKIRIPKEALSNLYCICRKPFLDGDEMMQCEICKEWYHLKCIGFNQSIEQAQSITFFCFQCEQKLSKEQKKHMKKYKPYFADPTFRNMKLMIGMSPHDLRAKEKKNYKHLSK